MNDRKLECQAWVQREIELAEQGRDELVRDIARRKEELKEGELREHRSQSFSRDIQCSEPRYTAPEKPKETAEFLTEAERAAVVKFVTDENRVDRERERSSPSLRRKPIRYGDPEPQRAEPPMTEHERSYSNSWEEWLATRLAEERAAVYEAVGMAVGELLDEEAKAHKAERAKLKDRLRDFEIALTNAKADITNLRTLLLTNGKDAGVGVLDLPPWPKRSEAKSVN
jgi:hypothetical protein